MAGKNLADEFLKLGQNVTNIELAKIAFKREAINGRGEREIYNISELKVKKTNPF